MADNRDDTTEVEIELPIDLYKEILFLLDQHPEEAASFDQYVEQALWFRLGQLSMMDDD